MDQDELFDVLQMPSISNEDDRKHVLALIREGHHALRKDYYITLKDLPDAMDRAVYVMERFPLVVDISGQAIRFLKYQRGTTLMVESPRDMTPESLRSHLVGALEHGTLLILNFDTLNTIELEQYFGPESFPRELLKGDPDPDNFMVNDQFKLVVVCRKAPPPPKTALAMCVLHVHLPSEENDNDDNAKQKDGLVAKALGRNSLELVEAAFDNDLEGVKRRLNQNLDLESEDDHGHTALSEAACQGNIEIAKLLLERGADPNKCNDKMRSSLYRASYNGHIETIQLLLESGADPRIHSKQAETAFDVAKTAKIRDMISQWDLARTDTLLEKRRQVIEAKWQERITTHVEREQFALMQIHQEILDLVHKGEVDALEKRFDELADESLATDERPRASADIRDEKGSTLLAIAAQYDHVELVRMLLTKWKVLVESAVQTAASSSSFTQQQLSKKQELLAKMLKTNVNARDCRGWAPVSIAVFHEAKRSLRALLEHGADPKLKNQYNKNAYDFAKDILDAANNVATSKAEIRQVLIDWENEQRRVVDVPATVAEGADTATTASTMPRKQKKTRSRATKVVRKTCEKQRSISR
uniref:Dynein heavy chain ATP-binding dynein motor region domain-containing protein n=1 Tax=Globisporangium ultimum (strain ATCC 200006 / CBS 805.95 / DAOM BR144) TaxID=431595 RepID=K3X276_GLOUD